VVSEWGFCGSFATVFKWSGRIGYILFVLYPLVLAFMPDGRDGNFLIGQQAIAQALMWVGKKEKLCLNCNQLPWHLCRG